MWGERGGEKGGNFFEVSRKGEPVKRKEKPHLNVWFRLNDLGSSQNGQNSFIQNWCTGGCWFTLAGHAIVSTHNSFPR
jgi:hypothetical protein